MLIRLTVGNFKSFDEKTELVMVSSSKIRLKREHVKDLHGAKVLKYAAVYGANAAGKSNLIDVFRFIQEVLSQGLTMATASSFCRNVEENRKRPSVFELQFSCAGRVFAYGFKAVLSDRRVVEEWLYDLSDPAPVELLLRDAIDPESFSSGVMRLEQDRVRFETYAADFMGETNRLFLDELNRSKRYAPDSAFEVFGQVYEWITQNIVTVYPTLPLRDASYLLTDEGMDRVGKLLSSFDTGVSQLYPEEISPEAFAEAIDEQYIRWMQESVDAKYKSNPKKKIRGGVQTSEGFYFFDISGEGVSNVSMLRLRHRNVDNPFDYLEESDGTRRLLDLLNILLSTKDDMVYVVDELERSLHPTLVRRFLKLFMEQNVDTSRQLVFSTHEASIMDQDLFRRDEIWFIDRNDQGDSRLYSLDRFKERFDKDIAKAYLDGRYGAVPVFSDFS